MFDGHMWLVGTVLDSTNHTTLPSLQKVLLDTTAIDYASRPSQF